MPPRLRLAGISTLRARQSFGCAASGLRALSTMGIQPKFPDGADSATLETALSPLLSTSDASGGRWALADDGRAIERTFKFKTFAKTWDFMTAVSLQCKLKSHHPEWSNVFNTTFIRWTTHDTVSLSSKDIEMAKISDSLAKDFGEVEQVGASDEMQQLADKAGSAGGRECCAPKK